MNSALLLAGLRQLPSSAFGQPSIHTLAFAVAEKNTVLLPCIVKEQHKIKINTLY